MKQAGHRRTGTARLHTREALAGVGATVTEAGGRGRRAGGGERVSGKMERPADGVATAAGPRECAQCRRVTAANTAGSCC